MFKKSFYFIFIFIFFFLSFQIVEAKDFTLEKKHWAENHYDAEVFDFNGQICAAGPYADEIRTYCLNTENDNWEEINLLKNEEAEYLGLDKVLVWKDQLYYFVDRGITDSNNDTSDGVEIWKLENDNWNKVFSLSNKNAYLIDVFNSNNRIYFAVRRYNAKPHILLYNSKNGNDWNKMKSKSNPVNLSGMAILNGTIYAYDTSSLYKRKSNGRWISVYDVISTDNDMESINGLIVFKSKLYMSIHHYIFNDSGYEMLFNIKTSKNGKIWKNKRLRDKAINGSEYSVFYSDGEQLWLLAYHIGKKRDLLWRLPGNIRNISSNNKKIIPKSKYLRINGYYLRDFVKSGKEFYFTDSHGNIYRKK